VRYPTSERMKKSPNPEYICRKKTGKEDIRNEHTTVISQPLIDEEGWKYTVEVLRNPAFVRQRVAIYREKHRVEDVDTAGIHARMNALQQQITNLFKLAKFATDDDSISQLAFDMNGLEDQKRQLQAML